MARRGSGRITWGDVRRGIAWFFVTIFFAASTWFIVTAFFNYYYTLNVTQYVASFVGRIVSQDLALNYTCSASPCRIDMGPGDKVLNLTVENPTSYPPVLLLREGGGAKAAVAVYGSARPEFDKPPCGGASSSKRADCGNVAINETTTASIHVSQVVGVEPLFSAVSTLCYPP